MFENLQPAPPDPILGLTEAFQRDANPQKVNLGVGVYRDSQGRTPTLACVRAAEARLLEQDIPKTYLPITGDPAYGAHVQRLLFGPEHDVVTQRRAVSAHTPGGTGGLRVAADFIRTHHPQASVWLSDPTWANHVNVFGAAGLPVKRYGYYHPETKRLDFDRMMRDLMAATADDVVLLHGCCHNPTGIDPTPDQWTALKRLQEEKGFLPLFDIAYQGLGDGLTEDVAGLHTFVDPDQRLIVASSFSKNFGLYSERVGAVTLVGTSEVEAELFAGHLKRSIRFNYSNPPRHGAAVVTTVLNDPALESQWQQELGEMRGRIQSVRQQLVEGLKRAGATTDFSFIVEQRGMFSFSGLTQEQVQTLRDKFAIYIVGSGRINVAGLTPDNLNYVCEAIAEVV